jgi:uncharacterized protein with HEPN domain
MAASITGKCGGARPDPTAQIPWRLIIAMRNRLIHGYLGIDNDTLWSVIKTDIPALLPQLAELTKRAG